VSVDRRGRWARSLGRVGGLVGVAAGLTQALVGRQIPAWTGDKSSPVVLGLVTVLLSTGALIGASDLSRRTRPSAARRGATLVGYVVPALVCSTTVGRLWVVPGALLLAGAVCLLLDGPRSELVDVVRTQRAKVLITILVVAQLAMAATSGRLLVQVVGLIGGLLVLGVWGTSRPRPAALLVALGTTPFAVLAWTALVPVLVALLAVGLALAVRPARAAAVRPAPAVPVVVGAVRR
jgi:hypothetical protein